MRVERAAKGTGDEPDDQLQLESIARSQKSAGDVDASCPHDFTHGGGWNG